MTTHDAAAELDVMPGTVAKWCAAGLLKAKKVLGKWNVNGASVRKLRRQRTQAGR